MTADFLNISHSKITMCVVVFVNACSVQFGIVFLSPVTYYMCFLVIVYAMENRQKIFTFVIISNTMHKYQANFLAVNTSVFIFEPIGK